MTMAGADLSCDEVEREELDLQYLRGQLSPERAEAFEAHYFGCDRCFQLVRAGRELQATRPARRSWLGGRWPLLAAAVLVAAVGVVLLRPRPVPLSPDTERAAPAGALSLSASASAESLSVHWSPLPGAAGYRVRLYRQDGSLASERELADTALAITRAGITGSGPWFWQVSALDRQGGELARSALVEAEQLRRTP